MSKHVLTEIEGAILSEIAHRGQKTAFQVRRAFQSSPSIEWSGSAGSVYPAVKRLREKGLIEATPTGDAKSTMHLSLSKIGETALMDWSTDPQRSTSVGIDPFRLRSGIWTTFPKTRRRQLFARLADRTAAEIASLEEEIGAADPVEAVRLRLNVALHKARLEWLEAQD